MARFGNNFQESGRLPNMRSRDEVELRRLALSCLLLAWDGPRLPDWLARALEAGLGGVVLFAGNVTDGAAPEVTAAARAAAGRDAVVAIDEEGGLVTRLDAARGSRSPGAAALGHLDDVEVTQAVHRDLALRCAAAGVTLNLAPVADVAVDPRNPVIGLRAFSADPAVAGRHVAAAVRGIQGTGVAACLKHFPGHGATCSDSHLATAVLDRSRRELDAVEFGPFRAGIEAGARAVMTGHLHAPALDPDRQATVSPRITQELLRGELGFGGTVVTDALEMAALADTVGIVPGVVAALAAGADCIETGAAARPELVTDVPDAVVTAVADRRLTRQRLTDASRRTAALATPPPVPAGPAEAEEPDTVSRRCLEVLGALPQLRAPLVIECRTPGTLATGRLRWDLGGRLAELLPGTEVLRTERTVPLPADGRPVVLVVSDPQRRDWQQPMLDAVAGRPETVVVDVGWPLQQPDAPLVRTRGVTPGLLAAAAELLSGRGGPA